MPSRPFLSLKQLVSTEQLVRFLHLKTITILAQIVLRGGRLQSFEQHPRPAPVRFQ